MHSQSHFKFIAAIQMTPSIGIDLASLRSGPIVQEAILIVHPANSDGSINTASCIYILMAICTLLILLFPYIHYGGSTLYYQKYAVKVCEQMRLLKVHMQQWEYEHLIVCYVWWVKISNDACFDHALFCLACSC